MKVGGRARLRAGAGAARRSSCPSARCASTRFEQRWREGDRAAFAIDCSSGTYVRSLVADLGDAYCVELRRTAIGEFGVADADAERVVPLGDALRFLPEVRLAGDDARRARTASRSRGAARRRPPCA